MGIFFNKKKRSSAKRTTTRKTTTTKKEWINPSEYTINMNSTTKPTSYIKDRCVNNEKSLASLCALVCPTVSPVRRNLKVIITSAVQKCDTIAKHADTFYKAALSTSDVDEFFKDMAVVKRDHSEMKKIEKYIYYGGIPGGMKSQQINERFQIEVRHLIDRAYSVAVASGEPEKLATHQLTAFKKNKSKLDEQSQKKLNSKYKKYIK